MFSISNFEPKFYWKILSGKWFFQIVVTWLFSRDENSSFGRHFEKVHFFLIYGFLRCMLVWCKLCTKILTKKYLKIMVGSKWTPLCTNRSEKLFKHFLVVLRLRFSFFVFFSSSFPCLTFYILPFLLFLFLMTF